MQTIHQPLISNGFTIPSERLGWLIPTDPATPLATLREQYTAQGYLWLKGILDPKVVLSFRHRVFEAFRETGLLAAGTDATDGIFAGELPDGAQHTHPNKILMEVVRWAAYEAFCLQPAVWQFFETFLAGPVYLHKRKILRYTKPGDPNCTGAHYDLAYLRGGTDKVLTSWIPMGDCPVAMGGLIYLEGSHTWGRAMEAEFTRKSADLPPDQQISAYNKHMSQTGWLGKDLNNLAEQTGGRWLMADYEAGDMVVHGPYTIHASTVNEDAAGRLRLSTDIRYQHVRDEIDARWGNHWTLDDML